MKEGIKRWGRNCLRWYCQTGWRGRSRLIDTFSSRLAPLGAVETVRIGNCSLSLDHHVRAMRMMAYGVYEFDECQHLRQWIRRGDVVFDIGANIGYMSAQFALSVGPAGRVYAFEPSPTCHRLLCKVADSNPHGIIMVESLAVADESRNSVYYETEKILSHCFGRIDIRPSAIHQDISEYPIYVTTIDDYLDGNRLDRLDFVKIDVEGAEGAVLHGMQRTFARGLHPILLIEMTGSPLHLTERESINKLLTGLGYRSYRVAKRVERCDLGEISSGFHGNIVWLPSTEA